MSLIRGILPPNHIVIDHDSHSKQALFERVGILFEQTLALRREHVVDSLQQREKLGSTALGKGIAIPHGRIAKLREASAALIKLANGIPFDSPDGQPVQWAFVLLVPERATDLHLQILGELAQMFSDTDFRAQMNRCEDSAALYQLFCNWQPS